MPHMQLKSMWNKDDLGAANKVKKRNLIIIEWIT
jgi:hypothetical protein